MRVPNTDIAVSNINRIARVACAYRRNFIYDEKRLVEDVLAANPRTPTQTIQAFTAFMEAQETEAETATYDPYGLLSQPAKP